MNKPFTTFALLSCAAISGVGLIQSANADEWDKKTTVTINEPIELHHKVLEAGSYVFKLLDSQSDRHIVQIYTADESKLLDTILAIPNYRLQPRGHSVFTFWETPAGQPPALRAWFYPGDNFGQEFLDSKPAAVQTASTTTVPVTYGQSTQSTEVARNEPVPAPQSEPAPAPVAVTPEPTPEPAPAPAPAPAPEPAPAPLVAQNEPVALPQTASYFPVIALAGLLSLGLFGLMTLSGSKRTL
jgi:hypothetical protein